MATGDKEIESIQTVIPAIPVSLPLGPQTRTGRALDESDQPLGMKTTDIIHDFQTHRETQHAHSTAQHVWVRFRVAHAPASYRVKHEDEGHRLAPTPLRSLSGRTTAGLTAIHMDKE